VLALWVGNAQSHILEAMARGDENIN